MTTTSSTVPSLLSFAGIVRRHILTRWRADSCIASTRIGVHLMGLYGIPAAAQPVQVVAANAQAVDLVTAGVPCDRWPHGAWTVGTDDRPRDPLPGRWPGHLVVRVGDNRIVDLSADQFDRPARGLRITGPVTARIPPGWSETVPAVVHAHRWNTTVWYRPSTRADWVESPDWLSNRQDVVEEVVAEIRAELVAVGWRPVPGTEGYPQR